MDHCEGLWCLARTCEGGQGSTASVASRVSEWRLNIPSKVKEWTHHGRPLKVPCQASLLAPVACTALRFLVGSWARVTVSLEYYTFFLSLCGFAHGSLFSSTLSNGLATLNFSKFIRYPVMHGHPVHRVFLHHIQCFQDRLWIYHDPDDNQDFDTRKAVQGTTVLCFSGSDNRS